MPSFTCECLQQKTMQIHAKSEMIGQKIKQTDPVLEEFLRYRQDPNVERFTTRINHQRTGHGGGVVKIVLGLFRSQERTLILEIPNEDITFPKNQKKSKRDTFQTASTDLPVPKANRTSGRAGSNSFNWPPSQSRLNSLL